MLSLVALMMPITSHSEEMPVLGYNGMAVVPKKSLSFMTGWATQQIMNQSYRIWIQQPLRGSKPMCEVMDYLNT